MRRRQGQFATVHNVPVILDLGHWGLKGIVGDDARRRITIPHALNELNRDDWNNLVEIGDHAHPGYIQVGTRYYEVGEIAQRHSAVQAESIARYRRNYYGVLMCSVIANLFSPDEIEGAVVFASYPPGDRRHKDDLEASLLGRWEFVNRRRKYNITVRQVVSYTEPLGGFWNWVIREDERGQHYDNPDYDPNRATLVIDLGGGTMSMLPIGRDQLPDFSMAESFPIGFNSVARDFQRELRANHRDLFRAARVLDDGLLHEALQTGRFYGGGMRDGMDVSTEVSRAMGRLLDQFRAAYERLGGPMPYGQIILTGGGSAVLGEHLRMQLNHQRVAYAHDNPHEMHFANVMGGLKAYRELFGVMDDAAQTDY